MIRRWNRGIGELRNRGLCNCGIGESWGSWNWGIGDCVIVESGNRWIVESWIEESGIVGSWNWGMVES